jgi:membrane protein DedA with SNARE-associated domain
MNVKQLLTQIIRAIIVLFIATTFLDYLTGRDRTLESRIFFVSIAGIVLGAIWYYRDNHIKKKKIK